MASGGSRNESELRIWTGSSDSMRAKIEVTGNRMTVEVESDTNIDDKAAEDLLRHFSMRQDVNMRIPLSKSVEAATPAAGSKRALSSSSKPSPKRAKLAVDEFSGIEDGQLAVDPESGTVLSASMNLVDKKANADKFYHLQVIEENGKFFVFKRYGRNGTKGATTMKKFPTLEKARASFASTFLEKSGNEFEGSNAQYPSKKGKYTIETNDEEENDEDDDGLRKKIEENIFAMIRDYTSEDFMDELINRFSQKYGEKEPPFPLDEMVETDYWATLDDGREFEARCRIMFHCTGADEAIVDMEPKEVTVLSYKQTK